MLLLVICFAFTIILILSGIHFRLKKAYISIEIQKQQLENKVLKKDVTIENLELRKTELEEEVSLRVEQCVAAEKRESERIGQNKTLEETIKKYQELIEHAKKELALQFKNTANTLLEEKSKTFSQDSKEKIHQLIEPLGKNIKSFQEAVDKNLKENFSEQITLKNLITPLTDKIAQLTLAMKGDCKVQGDWGEMILEKILEVSGFIKGVHYHLQGVDQALKTDEGQYAKPDCIFCLPDNKKVVIDSKVSIKHALDYFGTESQNDREDLIEKHLSSVREHIKSLSNKNYQNLTYLEGSLDFVVMFIPNDFALFVAFANDERIQNYAIERKVMLLSPTLLIPFLHIIKSFFQLHEINKNTMQISHLAGKMYNQLSGFLTEFSKIKGTLDSAVKSYDNACTRLKGQQGVIRYAEKVRELGAKVNKQIPREFLDEFISFNETDDSVVIQNALSEEK